MQYTRVPAARGADQDGQASAALQRAPLPNCVAKAAVPEGFRI